MASVLLQLRAIHICFISTWFLYLGLIFYLRWPEKPVPIVFPLALGAFAILSISVALKLRRQLLFASAAALASQPENVELLKRWRAGNIMSFAFAESIMLFGVLLKLLGAAWNVVGIFFVGGLILILLWTPRAITPKS